MTLAELAEAIGVPPRQIRFLISEGVLPPAIKTGRSADAYDDAHLAKARRYITLHNLGMKPTAIKVLMEFDEAIPIYQSKGIELRIDPSKNLSKLNIESTVAEISRALRIYLSKE